MLNSSSWLFNDQRFYNGVATQSLRLNPADTLTENYGTPTSSTIMSFGGWVKRLKGGHYSNLYSSTLGGAGVEQASMYFDTDDKFKILSYTGSSYVFNYVTTRLFRDFSSWYHIWIQIDTTDATQDDRVKIWINGIRETSFSTETKVGSGSPNVSGFNSSGKTQYFGHTNSSYGGHVYYSDWYFIDGSAVSPVDTVGEFKNGVFIPKSYSPTFGTNGWHLEFNQTGTGTGSSSTIGADTSGNDNHFSSSGIVASDCDMPDSPENNFATLNPLYATENANFSEGNLKLSYSSGTFNSGGSTISTGSMKFYTEVLISASNVSPAEAVIGVVNADKFGWNSDNYNPSTGSNGVGYFCNTGVIANGYGTNGSGATLAQGDILGIACDGVAGTMAFYKNGTLQDTVTVTTGLAYNVAMADTSRFTNDATFIVNFGQDSTFAGATTAGGNADGNGKGDFKYSVPSGYLALCTANLPEPTISPNADTQADDYFNTVLYTGIGSTQSITGVGFQPDWVWIKRRDGATGHRLFDSNRGFDSGNGRFLQSDNTSAELSTSDFDSFDSDGFSVSGTGNATNASGNTFASWNWKAGGTAVSNTDGTITSSVSANTDAGFSIVSFTGNGSNDATIGHGLGTTPAMIITKNRDDSVNWRVWHKDLTSTYVLFFSTLGESSPSGQANGYIKTVGSSTYSVYQGNTDTNGVNGSGDAMIAYCFAEIEGYSKFGSYTGNGSTDGTFVYTGFRPAWVMMKVTSVGTNGWQIRDVERSPFNTSLQLLYANVSIAEISSAGNDFDVLSNGFKLRNSGGDLNASGATYIYMAFAENPFKYANAR